jgi:hypothetical protein
LYRTARIVPALLSLSQDKTDFDPAVLLSIHCELNSLSSFQEFPRKCKTELTITTPSESQRDNHHHQKMK